MASTLVVVAGLLGTGFALSLEASPIGRSAADELAGLRLADAGHQPGERRAEQGSSRP